MIWYKYLSGVHMKISVCDCNNYIDTCSQTHCSFPVGPLARGFTAGGRWLVARPRFNHQALRDGGNARKYDFPSVVWCQSSSDTNSIKSTKKKHFWYLLNRASIPQPTDFSAWPSGHPNQVAIPWNTVRFVSLIDVHMRRHKGFYYTGVETLHKSQDNWNVNN